MIMTEMRKNRRMMRNHILITTRRKKIKTTQVQVALAVPARARILVLILGTRNANLPVLSHWFQ